jgi:Protein of unknown function (DUF4127)
MNPVKSLVFLPLDARPVCYQTPQLLMKMANIEPLMPLAEKLGNLKTPANLEALFQWLEPLATLPSPAIIVALDLIAYGGLIPSRIGLETPAAIEQQLVRFYGLLQGASNVYGYSSILRIPTYNGSEEEPDYWAIYGAALQQFSSQTHQAMLAETPMPAYPAGVPLEVVLDFLNRRHRNFSLNQYHLACLANGLLRSLVFCEDDRTPFGLNVAEAQELKSAIEAKNLPEVASVQTGADEIGHCLLALHLNAVATVTPAVWVVYTHPNGAESDACFDGLPLEAVVTQRLATCGLKRADSHELADLVLLVHCPASVKGMGDYCENRLPVLEADAQYATALAVIQQAQATKKPVVIVDVASANGGDVGFFETVLLPQPSWCEWLYGYAGWNTPGNSIGSALAMASIRLRAEAEGGFNLLYFQQLLVIRLADDVIYQSKVRSQLRQLPADKALDVSLLNTFLADDLALIKAKTGMPLQQFEAYFPCNRTFEVGFRMQEG